MSVCRFAEELEQRNTWQALLHSPDRYEPPSQSGRVGAVPEFRQPYVLLETKLDCFREIHSFANQVGFHERLTWNPADSLQLKHEAAWCSTFSCLEISQMRDPARFQVSLSKKQISLQMDLWFFREQPHSHCELPGLT
ncbi:hypothetical protein T265_06324 [Opisthorchis viverrini]|uniref:Uncharacterized protein n=1 Tax=Opisthorchis viverrini TaxID=6198 RepID=A0A074ZGR5_OPIVI|nr:hypothetical protein T265_06324 [Opisthorchis viverrini]KER26403.1 hypothetical protein T265_06324 [Opisthorchis viverrini]